MQRYKAYYKKTKKIIYDNEPSDNLFGLLPWGAICNGKGGTLNRKDGGNP